MLLRSKSSLLNSHILHLILSLVGTLDSEHECTEIPYPEAFRDLLAGACVGEGGENWHSKKSGRFSAGS